MWKPAASVVAMCSVVSVVTSQIRGSSDDGDRYSFIDLASSGWMGSLAGSTPFLTWGGGYVWQSSVVLAQGVARSSTQGIEAALNDASSEKIVINVAKIGKRASHVPVRRFDLLMQRFERAVEKASMGSRDE